MQDNDAFLILKLLALILLGALTFPLWVWLVPWALIEWKKENKEKGELAHKTEKSDANSEKGSKHLYDLDQNFELKGGKRNGDNLGTPGPLRRNFKTIPAGR